MVEAGGVDRPKLRGPGLEGPGFALVERTAKTIARHGWHVAPEYHYRGDVSVVRRAGPLTLLVAVSGGADSTCLLDVLARLRSTFEMTLHVAHIDHGLSESSGEVAARVAHDAAAAGFEVHVTKAPDLSGANLQERARLFRYQFLEAIRDQVGADRIATGHTLDDRVETLLARLIHGGGADALAGLRPGGWPRIRPLIESRRAETRAYCIERGLEFVDDPANEDLRFERVAVRQKIVAAIEEHWGDGAVRAIARSADRLAEDEAVLSRQMFEFFEKHVEEEQTGEYRYRLASFLGLPRALRRRVLQLTVGRLRDRAAAIDDVLDALERAELKRPARFALPKNGEIIVEADRLIVRAPGWGPIRGEQ